MVPLLYCLRVCLFLPPPVDFLFAGIVFPCCQVSPVVGWLHLRGYWRDWPGLFWFTEVKDNLSSLDGVVSHHQRRNGVMTWSRPTLHNGRRIDKRQTDFSLFRADKRAGWHVWSEAVTCSLKISLSKVKWAITWWRAVTLLDRLFQFTDLIWVTFASNVQLDHVTYVSCSVWKEVTDLGIGEIWVDATCSNQAASWATWLRKHTLFVYKAVLLFSKSWLAWFKVPSNFLKCTASCATFHSLLRGYFSLLLLSCMLLLLLISS